MKVLCVVGTRPEAIKMVPAYYALKARRQDFQPLLVTTAQHRHMLDQIFQVFDLAPDIYLDLMPPEQQLADLTAKILTLFTPIVRDVKQDVIMVQGDTTSALAASLVSFDENVPIGHGEAGLRTYDISSPCPEEMNRRFVDAISQWCLTI